MRDKKPTVLVVGSGPAGLFTATDKAKDALSKLSETHDVIIVGDETDESKKDKLNAYMRAFDTPPEYKEQYLKITEHGHFLNETNRDKTVPVRTEPKIGRNKSCPCESGKKYKNCCGLKN